VKKNPKNDGDSRRSAEEEESENLTKAKIVYEEKKGPWGTPLKKRRPVSVRRGKYADRHVKRNKTIKITRITDRGGKEKKKIQERHTSVASSDRKGLSERGEED